MKKLTFLTLLLLSSLMVFAQSDDEYEPAPIPEETNEPAPQKKEEEEELVPFERSSPFEYLFAGGNANFALSNNGFQFGMSPAFGVGITKNFRVGAGPSFEYYSLDRGQGVENDKYTFFGGRLFGQYHVTSGIFVALEYDKQWIIAEEQATQINQEFPNRLMPGLGYNTKGDFETPGMEFSVELMYNVLHDDIEDPRQALIYRASAYFTF